MLVLFWVLLLWIIAGDTDCVSTDTLVTEFLARNTTTRLRQAFFPCIFLSLVRYMKFSLISLLKLRLNLLVWMTFVNLGWYQVPSSTNSSILVFVVWWDGNNITIKIYQVKWHLKVLVYVFEVLALYLNPCLTATCSAHKALFITDKIHKISSCVTVFFVIPL